MRQDQRPKMGRREAAARDAGQPREEVMVRGNQGSKLSGQEECLWQQQDK